MSLAATVISCQAADLGLNIHYLTLSSKSLPEVRTEFILFTDEETGVQKSEVNYLIYIPSQRRKQD